mmetsp:Transcript_6273/g.14435  ORF Transcript_6273/g.14435 Transcript_6273/m.14435 type:complete len:269 (-) Transcript_6273:1069-1875(-)
MQRQGEQDVLYSVNHLGRDAGDHVSNKGSYLPFIAHQLNLQPIARPVHSESCNECVAFVWVGRGDGGEGDACVEKDEGDRALQRDHVNRHLALERELLAREVRVQVEIRLDLGSCGNGYALRRELLVLELLVLHLLLQRLDLLLQSLDLLVPLRGVCASCLVPMRSCRVWCGFVEDQTRDVLGLFCLLVLVLVLVLLFPKACQRSDRRRNQLQPRLLLLELLPMMLSIFVRRNFSLHETLLDQARSPRQRLGSNGIGERLRRERDDLS